MANKGNVRIEVSINGKEAVNEFERISQKVDSLKTKTNELKDANKDYSNTMRILKAELALLTKGTEEYASKKADIDKLKTAMKENGEAIKKNRLEQSKLTEELEETRKKLGINDMTFKQLKQTVSALAKEVEDLIPGTEKFIQKSEELKKVNERYKQVRQEIQGYQKEIAKTSELQKGITQGIGQAIGNTAVGSLSNMTNYLQKSLGIAGQVSDKFADIRKTAGLTEQEVKKFGDELQKINTRTSFADLLDIAKVGGQVGIAKDQLLEFTKSVDRAVVALGDEFSGGAEEVARTMGTLKNLFAETKNLDAGKAINDIGSAVNALGSAGTATGPVIAEFASRIGQLPGGIAPTLAQSLGLGAALQELGLTAEIASGGLTNVFLKAGENVGKFAQQLKITPQEFRKAFNEDSNAIILRLAQSLKGLSDTQIIETMDRLGIGTQESIKVLGQLANNTQLVEQKQKLANEELKKGTSLTAEFNIKNKTLQADIERAGKEANKFALELGGQLAPAFIYVLQAMTAFFNILRSLPKTISDNIAYIILLTTAYFTYSTSVIASNVQSLISITIEKAKRIAIIATTTVVNIAATAYLFMTNSLFRSVAIARLATTAQWLFNAAITANPIGLIVVGVGALIAGFVALYQSTGNIIGVFTGLGSAIVAMLTNFKKLLSLDFSGWWKGVKDAYAEAYGIRAKERQDFANDTKNRIAQTEERIKKMKDKMAQADKDKAEADKKTKEDQKQRVQEATKEEIDAYNKRVEELKKAQEKYDEANLKAKQKLEDLRLELIDDSLERERQKIAIDASRKKEDIEKQIKELKGLEAVGVKIDPQAIPNLQKQIELVQAEAQKKLEQVELKQTIRVIEIQESQAKRTLVETTTGATDEQKLQARKAFNQKMLALQMERIDAELKTLDTANQEDIAKINNLNTQKLDLINNQQKEELSANLTAIEEKYALLQEAEEIKFIESNASYEEQRKQIIEENFDSFLESEKERNQALYELEKASLQERLKLLEDSGQGQTAEALKIKKSIAQNDADYNEKMLNNEMRTLEIKRKAFEQNAKFASDFIQIGIDLLGIDEESRKNNADVIKAFTVGKILADLASEVAGYFTTVDSTLSLGVTGGIKAGLATARAGVSIASVINQKFAKGGLLGTPISLALDTYNSVRTAAKTYATGGMVRNAGVLSGSSHAQGGLSVFDNRTGQQVAEFEGGEPAMVLSTNTYKNNKSLIDSLLYSSLYAQGAPVRSMAQGGTIGTTLSPQNLASPAPTQVISIDMSELISEIRDLKAQVAQQQTLMRAFVVYQDIQEADAQINELVQKNSF